MKKILCCLLFFTCSITILYAQVIFTGQGDGHSWEDSQNWRKNGVSGLPQTGDDILIDGFQVDITYYLPEKYNNLELRNNANLFTQSDIYLSGDIIIDVSSTFEVSVQDLDIFNNVVCDGNYYINGAVTLRYDGHVPQIGDSYQIIGGYQGSCGTSLSFEVSSVGYDVSIGVECDSDGVYYTVTGINYTTAIAWDDESGDGLWNNPANWDPNGIPPADSILIFNQPEGSYASTVGAGITDVNEIYIGRNNTLQVNGDLLLTRYVNVSKGATFNWNAGKIYRKSITQQSLIRSFGSINLDGPGTKELDTDVEIWTFFEDINHNQGDLNINNGIIRVFNGYNYNINDDNIDIGYTMGNTHQLIFNYGSVKKTNGNGVSTINLTPFNNIGNIISESGTLAITGNLTTGVNGTYGGSGSIQFPAGFVLDGKLAPGSSPGILTIVGDLSTSSTATFNIEITGPNAGTQYDQILVTNTAILEGIIEIALGYLPANDASFQILKAATLSSCDFPAQITTNFSGTPYTFDVVCQNNILYLNGPGFTLSNEKTDIQDVAIYPNPVKDVLNIKSSLISKGHWQLINGIGQVVKEADYSSNEFKISLNNMSSGLYFFKLEDAGLKSGITKKITISN